MTILSPVVSTTLDSTCHTCCSKLESRNSISNNKRQKYHVECLKCCHCNEEIDYDYYNQNGKPLCLNCKLINAKNCTICSQKVFGDSLTFDNKLYHNNCFRCQQCMKLLKGRKLLLDKSGEPSCDECLSKHKHNEKTCKSCIKPLSRTKSFCKSFEGDYFHTDCMKCTQCKIQISGTDKFFRSGQNQMICVDCGLKRIMSRITKLFTRSNN